MKKLFFFAVAALAFAACSDDDGETIVTCPKEHAQTISFEASENMLDVNTGEDMALTSVEMSLYGIGNYTYNNVLCAKPYLDSADYDGALVGTADQNVWFNTYYASTYDGWGGFALTQNFARKGTGSMVDQFTVWANKGALGTATCAVCYVDADTGGNAIPTIDFTAPCTVCHLFLANSAYTYTYEPTVVDAASYYYRVVIKGMLNGVSTGSVTCTLINGKNKVSDWTKVDMTSLGKVDQLVFNVESNEANSYGVLAPAYFAVDEIGLAAE